MARRRTGYESVDDYLAAQPAPTRAVLDQVRATIRKALPGATEGISYQIPVYELDGARVLFFAGFRGHCSIYPVTEGVAEALGGELAGRLQGKATLRLDLAEKVPTRLITRFAKLRASEAAALAAARGVKKSAARKAKPVGSGNPPPGAAAAGTAVLRRSAKVSRRLARRS